MPEVAALLDDLRHRQLAACLSGAGRRSSPSSETAMSWTSRRTAGAIRPGVRATGVEVVVEG